MKDRFHALKQTPAVLFAVLLLLFAAPFAEMNGVLPRIGPSLHAYAVCEEVIASGSCGKQGSVVNWTMYDDGSLILSGAGETEDYTGLTGGSALWNDPVRIVVEDGITKLGAYIFSDLRSITAVYLPSSLSALGNGAFENCSGITDVYYASSSENWASISKGNGNTSVIHANIHYDTEDIPAFGHVFDDWVDNVDDHIHTCNFCALEETADHEWIDDTIIKAATCKETGSKIVLCTVCGASRTESVAVNSANHADYGTRLENKADATCDKSGYTGDVVCNGCGAIVTKGEEIPVLPHDWDDWVDNGDDHIHSCNSCAAEETAPHVWNDGVITEKATCKETGSKIVFCTVCGATDTQTVDIDANNHADYGTHLENEAAATCTRAGYTGDTVCNGCGATLTNGQAIPSPGHDWSVWSDNGSVHVRTCGRCTKQETAAHNWNGGAVIKTATCKEQGAKQFDCTVCSKTKTEPIAFDPSNHADYGTHLENAAAATCTQTGYTGDTVCGGCGAVLIAGESISSLGHDWGAWSAFGDNHIRTCKRDPNHIQTAAHVWNNGTVTKQPTCKEPGSKKLTCTVCSAIITEAIAVDPNNHADYGTHLEHEKAAGCTENGYTGDKVCSGCGAILNSGKTISSLGHDWSAWSARGDCHMRICKRDANHTETAAHVWSSEVVLKKPTCKEQGTSLLLCATCGLSETKPTGVDLNNHADYGTHKEHVKNANCTEEGYTGDTVCNGCGSVISRGSAVPKNTSKHALTLVSATAATAEAEGNVQYYHCSLCGKNFSDSGGVNELTSVTTEALSAREADGVCKYCGERHTGVFGWLVKLIHSILALFGLKK